MVKKLLAEDGEPSKVGVVFAVVWVVAILLWIFGGTDGQGLELKFSWLTYAVPKLEAGTLTALLGFATGGLMARKGVKAYAGKAPRPAE